MKYVRMFTLGFSLIETMIAILISTIMLAGLVQIFWTSKVVSQVENNYIDIQENARFAVSYLSRIVRLAGYRSTPASGISYTDIDALFPNSAPYITGTNGTGTNGSDTLTIRYQGSGNGTGTPDGTVRDCLNNSVDANTVVTNTFSINANNELQCQAINPNATTTNSTQTLIANVENMQILYGEDLDGNGTADRYVYAGYPTLDLSRVVSLRINLLFRSNDSVDLTPTPITYYLNGATYTPTDGSFLRQPLTFTVVLRNLIIDPS